MINCLKSDFYRMFKSKTFYILLAVLAGLSFITVLILKAANSSFVMGIPVNGKYFFLMGLDDQAALFSAILISIFITGDFSSGMMKNYVAGNTSRTKIFFSKLIVCLTAACILLLADTLLLGSLASIFFGYGEFAATNISEFLVKFLLELLLLSAYVSIFAFIAFTMRSSGGVVSVNILITILVSVILSILASASSSLANIGDFWLDSNISYAALSGFPEGLKDHLLSILLTGTLYIPVFLIPAYAIFLTKDVR